MTALFCYGGRSVFRYLRFADLTSPRSCATILFIDVALGSSFDLQSIGPGRVRSSDQAVPAAVVQQKVACEVEDDHSGQGGGNLTMKAAAEGYLVISSLLWPIWALSASGYSVVFASGAGVMSCMFASYALSKRNY